MSASSSTLMLVLPLPIYRSEGQFWLDTQACNGLRLWLENFDSLIMVNPLIETSQRPVDSRPIRLMFPTEGLKLVPLPLAWTPFAFARALPSARRALIDAMDQSTDLQFAIGGLWGDWGAVAALIAARRGRKAAVWTDRVESDVMRAHALRRSGMRRLYHLLNAKLAQSYERYVIKRSALGLFHGADTYRAYKRFSRAPHLVHDIHLGPEARITNEDLTAKITRRSGGPLKVVYGGRAHPDKGVTDWIEVTRLLHQSGLDFEAAWFGDGPELEAARSKVEALGLESRVRFGGPTKDLAALMSIVQEADIFMFCHKTLESPRCLVEALLSGTPIVGYESAYPADLIAKHHGGVLTKPDPESLAAAVNALALDRQRLADLTRAAAADGHPFTDVDVFRHRSELIKTLR